VRRGTGEDLETAVILQLAERGDQVAVVRFGERAPRVPQEIAVEQGESLQRRFRRGAHDLALGEGDLRLEMMHVAGLQERIGEHVEERRRHRQREAIRNAVERQTAERVEERDVGLGECLEQPALFEEIGVLGMSDERQVRMQDEGDVPARSSHVRHRVDRCAFRRGNVALRSGDGQPGATAEIRSAALRRPIVRSREPPDVAPQPVDGAFGGRDGRAGRAVIAGPSPAHRAIRRRLGVRSGDECRREEGNELSPPERARARPESDASRAGRTRTSCGQTRAGGSSTTHPAPHRRPRCAERRSRARRRRSRHIGHSRSRAARARVAPDTSHHAKIVSGSRAARESRSTP
jgi:hypothetical protein